MRIQGKGEPHPLSLLKLVIKNISCFSPPDNPGSTTVNTKKKIF